MDHDNNVIETSPHMNEDFVLAQRAHGNGIKLSAHSRSYLVTHTPRADWNRTLHDNESDDDQDQERRVRGIPQTVGPTSASVRVRSITMSASKSYNRDVRLEFEDDASYDMWQFGRMEEPRNDWQIVGYHNETDFPMSRYSFRILACRRTRKCWLYAGGFDHGHELFLNPATIRWGRPPYDAFTTCGVLLWTKETQAWSEVSVLGHMYSLRPDHEEGGKKLHGPNITNELSDGALIHIGGTTLLFRTGDCHQGTSGATILRQLQQLQDKASVCPVQMTPLQFVSGPTHRLGAAAQTSAAAPKSCSAHEPFATDACTSSCDVHASALQPLVFLPCGHVLSNCPNNVVLDSCPVCRAAGSATPLQCDYHKAIADFAAVGDGDGMLSHAFNPCGHLTTEAVAKHWTSICIPGISNHYVGEWCQGRMACPFCNQALNKGQPYVKLHFS